MNDNTALSFRDSLDVNRDTNRWISVIELLIAFAPLVVLSILVGPIGADTMRGGAVILFGYLLSIFFVWLILKRRGTGWGEIGLAVPKSWRRTLLLGIGTFFASVIVYIIFQIVLVNLFPLEPLDQSRFNPLAGNLTLTLGMVVVALTITAFGEEILWRGLLITRLAKLFQNTKAAWISAAVLSSLVFGLVHYVEGTVGIVSTAAFGLVLALIYLRYERNLWVTIVAHGLANSIRFILIMLMVS